MQDEDGGSVENSNKQLNRNRGGRSPLALTILGASLLLLGGALLWDIASLVERSQVTARVVSNPASVEGMAVLNLQAQQEVARWTLLSVVTAFIGTSVGAAGLLFLAGTLRAATQANAINADSARSQTRAYVTITRSQHRRVFDRFQNHEVEYPTDELWLTIANSGQTPAVNVSYYCEADLSTDARSDVYPGYAAVKDHKYLNSIPAGSSLPFKAGCFGIALHFNHLEQALLTVDNHTRLMDFPIVTITGSVFYEDVFGDTFQSDFCFIYEGDPHKKYSQELADMELIQTRVPMFHKLAARPAPKA